MKLPSIKRMALWTMIAGAISPAVGMTLAIFGLPLTIFLGIGMFLVPIWILWGALAKLAERTKNHL